MEYASQVLYDALIQSTDDYLYLCNMKTGVFRYSPALVAAFELPGEVVKSPLIYWRQIVHPDDWERFYKSNMEIGENKRDSHNVEFRARLRSGEYIWLRCRGHLMRDEYGEPLLFAGIMQHLGRQNKIDPLTQLFNQHVFIERLQEGIADEGLERLAVMVLDVDDFRQYNALYSREFGDELLRTLARTIQALLPENSDLFRLEGNHMGLLVSNSSEQEILSLFQTFQKRLQHMKRWQAEKINVQLSAGCAFFPKDGTLSGELYQYAEYALQYAKQHGKNQLVLFTEEILKEKNTRLELVRKLRYAVAHDYQGFYLHYQPQVNGSTGKITGVEALMRFQDQEGRRISPIEFIPILEAEGMISSTGPWVLRQAVRQARDWVKKMPDFALSINASAMQVNAPEFLPLLRQILEEEKFPRENLIIELTESCAVQNLNVFRDKFEQLQSMGIRVAMDDFGTGYSSLEILKNAPIDIVKIDRSFVKDILHSRFDATFISFIVSICHIVNIQVCLEGVETEEEFAFLKNMHLDCIQGYYFGRPMEGAAITGLLELSVSDKQTN